MLFIPTVSSLESEHKIGALNASYSGLTLNFDGDKQLISMFCLSILELCTW